MDTVVVEGPDIGSIEIVEELIVACFIGDCFAVGDAFMLGLHDAVPGVAW